MVAATLNNPTQTVIPVAPLKLQTQDILDFAFDLHSKKLTLARKQFKELIQSYGWYGGEERTYLKLGELFCMFSSSDLAAIEANTLFVLAKHHKKYAPVIQQLPFLGTITQDAVKSLMKQCNKPKLQVQEKSTVLRRDSEGVRYMQMPPIYDVQAGTMFQEMIEKEGLTAQQIFTEDLCLRKALNIGLFSLVANSAELETFNQESPIESAFVVNNLQRLLSSNDVTVITNLQNISLDNPAAECEKYVLDKAFEVLSDLSKQLFNYVENYTLLTLKEVKKVEQLVREIINFCNSQAYDQQWLNLAEITKRNSVALNVVIENTGSDNKEWFFNLPNILAEAAQKHPEELLWVDSVLREQAEALMSVQLN